MGLQILATISDQGRTNEGAIKLLKTETCKGAYIKRNEEYRDDIYEIELDDHKTMKIVYIFDVPYLMKCIRNNLLTWYFVWMGTKDVQNGHTFEKCMKLITLYQTGPD